MVEMTGLIRPQGKFACGVLGFKFEALLHNSKLVDIKQWLFSSSILEKVNASLPSGRNAAKVSFLM